MSRALKSGQSSPVLRADLHFPSHHQHHNRESQTPNLAFSPYPPNSLPYSLPQNCKFCHSRFHSRATETSHNSTAASIKLITKKEHITTKFWIENLIELDVVVHEEMHSTFLLENLKVTDLRVDEEMAYKILFWKPQGRWTRRRLKDNIKWNLEKCVVILAEDAILLIMMIWWWTSGKILTSCSGKTGIKSE